MSAPHRWSHLRSWGAVEVVDLVKLSGQAAREKHARSRAEEMKPRLTRMVVVVPDEVRKLVGLEVRRNEVVVGAASFGVPVEISALVERAMRHDWTERWQSARAMLDEVEQLLAGPATLTGEMAEMPPPAPPVSSAPAPKTGPC